MESKTRSLITMTSSMRKTSIDYMMSEYQPTIGLQIRNGYRGSGSPRRPYKICVRHLFYYGQEVFKKIDLEKKISNAMRYLK